MTTEAFADKVLQDTTGFLTTLIAALGDRLGLFRLLAPGPATSAELAARAALKERYVREWPGSLYELRP